MHKAKVKVAPITRRDKKCRVGGFTLYMRPATRALLVTAARAADEPLSRFIILECLRSIAKRLNKTLYQLLPDEEYQALVHNKYPKKRKPQK